MGREPRAKRKGERKRESSSAPRDAERLPEALAARTDGPRREPVQARSREAVARMLDAAATLFVERGFDSTTTDAIAERAGVSVGSVYRFYPNKAAIMRALLDRHIEQLDALFRGLEQHADVNLSPEQRVATGIDMFASYLANDPGFRAIWTSGHSSRELVTLGYQMSWWAASRVARLIGPHLDIAPDELQRVSLVVSEASFAVLALIAHDPRPDFARGLVDEVKRLVTRYLLPLSMPRT